MISNDEMTMLRSGAGLVIGSVSATGEPRAGRGWGIRFLDDGAVRVVVTADDPVLFDDLEGGLVAVTGADVRTFRSIQLKGRVRLVEPPTEDDLALAAEQTDLFFSAIWETDRTEFELQRRLLPRRMIALEFVPSSGFDQTPGPDAGLALEDRA
jgi:hypothetical protein